MRIIILGAGGVGTYLAKSLSTEGHDIIVIDSDPAKTSKISEQMDVMAITGTGTSISDMTKAGIEKTDMLLAVTSSYEVNIVACMIAKKFGVATKIARVRNEEYHSDDFVLSPQEIGVDMMINPEMEAAKEITHLIQYPNAIDMVEFEDGRIIVLGIEIDQFSPVLGQTLSSIVPLYKEMTFRAVAITRGGKTIIPSGNDKILKGDKFYIVVKSEMLEEVLKLASGQTHESNNIMILGGGKIGRWSARMLSNLKHTNIKLIESNRDKSQMIAEELPEIMVVQGDGTDIDLLVQEGINEMDMFIALTDDDETNIVSSLLAKHLEVKRTMTLISRMDYLPIVKTIGLDIVVNTRIITSNAILKYLRRGSIFSLNSLRGIDAETIEFLVPEKCKYAGMKLKDISFPQGSIVGAIVHGDDIFVPVGDSRIFPNDKVVIFSLPDAVKKVEKMFN